MSESEDRMLKSEAPEPYEDINLWSMYEKYRILVDDEWLNQWKGLMDGAIIFAGLFSAVITTFLVLSLQQMEPNTSQQTVEALETVSLQLKFIAEILQNSSNPASTPSSATILPPQPYVASNDTDQTYVIINILWALALVFSLMCALCSLLVQSWTHRYQARLNKAAGEIRSKSRRRYYIRKGFKKYGAYAFVAMIPTLLHISVFLFLAGLVTLFQSMDPSLGKMSLILSAIFGGGYVLMSLSFIVFRDWPYDTPISIVLKALIRKCCEDDPMDLERPNFTIFPTPEEDAPVEYDDLLHVISQRILYGTAEHAKFCKLFTRVLRNNTPTEGLPPLQAVIIYQIVESLQCPFSTRGLDGRTHILPHQRTTLIKYFECVPLLVRSFSWSYLAHITKIIRGLYTKPSPRPWKDMANACSVFADADADEEIRTMAMEMCILAMMLDVSKREDGELTESAILELKKIYAQCCEYTTSLPCRSSLSSQDEDVSSPQHGVQLASVLSQEANLQAIRPYILLFTTFYAGMPDDHYTHLQFIGTNAVMEYETMGAQSALAKAIIDILEERRVAIDARIDEFKMERAETGNDADLVPVPLFDLIQSIPSSQPSIAKATRVMAQILPYITDPESLFTIYFHLNNFVKKYPPDEEVRQMREDWQDGLVQLDLARYDRPQATPPLGKASEDSQANDDGKDSGTQVVSASVLLTEGLMQSPKSGIGSWTGDWNNQELPSRMGPPLTIIGHDPFLPPREKGPRYDPDGSSDTQDEKDMMEQAVPGNFQSQVKEPCSDAYSLPTFVR